MAARVRSHDRTCGTPGRGTETRRWKFAAKVSTRKRLVLAGRGGQLMGVGALSAAVSDGRPYRRRGATARYQPPWRLSVKTSSCRPRTDVVAGLWGRHKHIRHRPQRRAEAAASSKHVSARQRWYGPRAVDQGRTRRRSRPRPMLTTNPRAPERASTRPDEGGGAGVRGSAGCAARQGRAG